jgi:hypothetical protein
MVVSYRYMPMDLIGWLMMRPPIIQLGLDFIILWVHLFLVEKPFIAFSALGDPWAKHLKVLFFWLLSFASYFYPMGL